MRNALLAVTLTLILSAHAGACELGEPAADRPEAAAAFDFMVGEHDVTLHAWTGTTWSPQRPVNAEWHGRYTLGGQAVHDEWIDPQPGSEVRGINVRLYDAESGEWKMMWISTSGRQVQDLRAKVIDGVLTMWQVYPERAGWKAEFHMLGDFSWAREDFNRNEAGEWVPGFRLVATRRQACQS